MEQKTVINPGLGMKLCLAGIRRRFYSVEQISTAQLASLLAEQDNRASVLLLDVRAGAERQISSIKDSVFVNTDKGMEENVQEVKQLIDDKLKSQSVKVSCSCVSSGSITVVAYCSIGYRSSALVSNFLSSQSNVAVSPDQAETSDVEVKLFNLEGSIFKWANEGRPLVTHENNDTSFVHPYNSVWGKLLNENLRKWA